MARNRCDYMAEIAAEPVPLPGCPDVIVTRAYVYKWALREGYPRIGGFGSADYLAFGRKMSDRPLTDLSLPWVVHLLAYASKIQNGA